MATRQVVGYVASCDVCGYECEEGSGWGDTPDEAITSLLADPDAWTQNGGLVVCDTSDPEHDQARGGESPRLLAMSRDAMAVYFGEAA